MSIIAIANPVAGSGKYRARWQRIVNAVHYLEKQLETWWTERSGDGEPLAIRALEASAERILAVGGDGTVHEIINGLVRANPTQPIPVPVGLIAVGRGNDYARGLFLPRNIKDLFKVALGTTTQIMDVGRIECCDSRGRNVVHYFNNVAGFGLDANVATRLNLHHRRRQPGKLTYLGGILRELTELRNYRVRGTIDGDPFETRAFLFVIAIGKYFGGGLKIAPHADPLDGRFDLVWGEDFSRMDVLRTLPLVYRGKHLGVPGIHARTAVTLELDTEIPAPIEADGEVIGFTPLRATLKPQTVTIPVPHPG